VTARAPRFYIEGRLREGSTCALPEESAHHAVRVLRLRSGDEVTLFDGRGGEYAARIAAIERTRVAIDVLGHRAVEREAVLRVVLVQGVSSGERMDFTIRKAVELGVAEVHPVLAAASVARPKGERAAARHEHWQRIAIAACEQCGRNRIPKVVPLAPLSDYRAENAGLKLLLSPLSQTPLSKIAAKSAAFVVAAGPEAGFSAAEEAALVDGGFLPVRLGPRVLRTETAALAALAALNALHGDF
jgi:16S rRNA (uracil1498-N3)-methyltransferase